MTVALFLSSDPIHLAGHREAFTVAVKDAISGQQLGEFLLVFDGDGRRQYVTAAGQEFAEIDDVLNAICRRPQRQAA